MNKVFLSGVITETPSRFFQGDAVKHVSFPLCMRHKTKRGEVKRELYTIHAWNGIAEWAQAFLKQGQRVMIQGYLTQHNIMQADGGMYVAAEVTAEEFFPAMPKGAERQREESAVQSESDALPEAAMASGAER